MIKDFSECFHDELIKFSNEFCDDCTDFIEIKEKILDVEVKSKQTTKIPKFTLQLYALVYQRIMPFPKTDFEIKTVTTSNLFEFVHKIINVKINLHNCISQGKQLAMFMIFAIYKLEKIRTLFHVLRITFSTLI